MNKAEAIARGDAIIERFLSDLEALRKDVALETDPVRLLESTQILGAAFSAVGRACAVNYAYMVKGQAAGDALADAVGVEQLPRESMLDVAGGNN